MTDHRSAEAQRYRRLYKTTRWLKLRAWKLSKNPLCEWCAAKGRATATTQVHHSEPHKGNEAIFFDGSKLVSLCDTCHDSEAQGIEARGYSNAIGQDGWPTDQRHPANR